MCGIFGVTGCDNDQGLDAHARKLNHRGPDSFGSYFDSENRVYLGHCRLSIIDLSENGSQPMSNEDGTLWITYNGEVYNFQALRTELESKGHRFKSNCDTEVVLHAYEEWGVECLGRLNGMFAFAILDTRRKKLFLARDRVGIKPLHYGLLGNHFVFASELKAIIGLPYYQRRIHYPALFKYMIYRYISGAESIWEGVSRLLPGHYLIYDLEKKQVEISRFWSLEVKTEPWTIDSALERFEELLASAVQNCLISDVPLGIFLSGGLDSSSVTTMAARNSDQIDTFTVGFEGWHDNELEAARQTAQKLSTHHHEEMIQVGNFRELMRVFEYFDEPLGDSSIFPTFLVCAAARKHVKVVLSGDGGDEIFGGYKWYTDTEDCRPLKKFAFGLEPLLRMLSLDQTAWGLRCSRLEHYRRMTSPLFTLPELKRMFPDAPGDLFPDTDTDVYAQYYDRHNGKYKAWQVVDFFTFLTANNLAKVDRASMAHSLEVRVPLLDHRIVEFAFSLPDDLCIRNGVKKYLLQRFHAGNGLTHLLDQPKRGFSCPVSMFWPVQDMLLQVENGCLEKDGLLVRRELQGIIQNHEAYNWGVKLWLLAVLSKWYERWMM
ncbi:MAG: asparagine synthase (glutamine-hydrolyzing) [Acidobacteriia bacterium]|nr:asparagine synthase (glutamine-hydrolyzing) [Terriglobia bacterium]